MNPDYKNSGIELYNGDCLDIMKDIEDKSIDMIACDLPYGSSACQWDFIIPFESLWEQYKRIIKDNGAIVLTASQPFTSALVMSNIKMFKYEWIWHKSKSGSAFTAKYRPVSKHENVLVFAKGKTVYNPQMTEGEPYTRTHRIEESDINNHKIGINKREYTSVNTGYRYPTTVQYFQQKWRRQDQLHPTQKPVALFEYLIKTYTNENDLVLDNCLGSGTTAIAAFNLNRRCIGIESDTNYFNLAVDRINNHSYQEELFKIV